MARLLENRLTRRLATIPLTAIAAVVAVTMLPISLLVAVLLDRGGPWRRVRLVVLVTAGLVIEVVGMMASLVAWIVTACWTIGRDGYGRRLHAAIMGRYTSALLALLAAVLGTHVEWRDEAIDGPVIVLARHTSFFDAILPAVLLSRRNALSAHHVITTGLRFSPCIDLVGHRLTTRFINRRAGATELTSIEDLANQLDTERGAVIFPEGTFRTERRFGKAITRMRRRDPELATRAEALRHVLPPQIGGTAALLAGAPDADIVVCLNTGFEPFGTLDQIRATMVADHPIVIETWHIDRSEVPHDAEAQSVWLLELFERIDAWVDNELASRPNPQPL